MCCGGRPPCSRPIPSFVLLLARGQAEEAEVGRGTGGLCGRVNPTREPTNAQSTCIRARGRSPRRWDGQAQGRMQAKSRRLTFADLHPGAGLDEMMSARARGGWGSNRHLPPPALGDGADFLRVRRRPCGVPGVPCLGPRIGAPSRCHVLGVRSASNTSDGPSGTPDAPSSGRRARLRTNKTAREADERAGRRHDSATAHSLQGGFYRRRAARSIEFNRLGVDRFSLDRVQAGSNRCRTPPVPTDRPNVPNALRIQTPPQAS